ncbi:hypothetical protein GO009_11580 [Muricauda sp. TY007]|uniref:hypothetical protein n=1 Tax=Allomuricauda sp. TY007 TaxID=2683200 RepID=UPI0013BFF913|nr:hypothetical protein [Muricauda sp. TY007]NDV16667.1 hypothetical protein [Muricauda sp. TY007]
MIRAKYNFVIALLTIPLFTASCKDRDYEQMLVKRQRVEDSLSNTIEGKTSSIPKDHFETIVIEGCEYLIYKEEPDSNSAFGFMAHKGNCSNPIHIYGSLK